MTTKQPTPPPTPKPQTGTGTARPPKPNEMDLVTLIDDHKANNDPPKGGKS